jgi:hypothetical protein
MKDLGGFMRRNLALIGVERHDHNAHARPVTCLAFVILLSIAFWTGAVWIAEFLLRVSRLGY